MLTNPYNVILDIQIQYTLIIYITIAFIVLVILVILVAVKEKYREIDTNNQKNNNDNTLRNSIINEISEQIDNSNKKIQKNINDVSNSINLLMENGSLNNNPIISLTNADITNLDTSLDSSNKSNEESDSRFSNLTRLDNYFKNEYQNPTFNDSISLKDYCDAFRNFSAYNLHLYYDIKDIRRFIAGLAVTKLIILQGMSGTGKTSLALAFGKFLDNTTTVIPIQPMWKERTDLIGYYNEFTKEFNETDLLNKMYEANYNDQIYITVLDEMNIARVEYYFAEFLSLLELPNPDERNLAIVSSRWPNDPKKIDKEGKLRMPLNMWFIGTANNDDSTFAISDKVYDRAMVINLDVKAEPFIGKDTGSIRISSNYYYKKVNEALLEYQLSERNKRRIEKLDEYLVEKFHITFGNRIMKQINTYVPVLVACGGTELDGLDDILSRKVLRKLESKNPVYVKSQAEALCNKLDEIFGTDKMPLCKEAIINIEQNS